MSIEFEKQVFRRLEELEEKSCGAHTRLDHLMKWILEVEGKIKEREKCLSA